MIHGTVWKLEDNPIDTPFYFWRSYDEHCFDVRNVEEMESFIRSDLDELTRFLIDEVSPGASFLFVPQEEFVENTGCHKYSQLRFGIDSDNGPILCEYYEDKWGMIWYIDAQIVVKVMQ